MKEQEFSTRSGSKGKQGTKIGTDTEEQQLAVLGEVVVIAESLVELRWSCGGGVVVARRHAWPGRGGGRWWRRSWWNGE